MLRDGYGYTCLVHVRRVGTIGFASTLTWFGVVVCARKVAMSDSASSLTWYSIGMDGDGDVWSMHGLRRRMLLVGCLVREWELRCRMLIRLWHGAVSVLWMEIGN